MKINPSMALKNLMNGYSYFIDGNEYILSEEDDLCVMCEKMIFDGAKQSKYTSTIKKKIPIAIDMTLKQFIHKIETMSESDALDNVARIGLLKTREERIIKNV